MVDVLILRKLNQNRVEDLHYLAKSKEDLVDSVDKIKCKTK